MLPLTDAAGRVYTTPGGVPVTWNAGRGYDSLGRICTTQTVTAGDTYAGAWRVDAVGRVVVGALGAPPISFNAGLPFNGNGSIVGAPDGAPLAGDPYVHGLRVGAAGVYGTTAAIPVAGSIIPTANLAAAYARKRLIATWAGACLRVRRSSDNTEQDIGFDAGGLLNTAALTSFVGAGNGFVSVWYDQSGNGLPLLQATVASQPQIVSAGSVLSTIKCDGSNDWMQTAGNLPTGAVGMTVYWSGNVGAAGGAANQLLVFQNGTNYTVPCFNGPVGVLGAVGSNGTAADWVDSGLTDDCRAFVFDFAPATFALQNKLRRSATTIANGLLTGSAKLPSPIGGSYLAVGGAGGGYSKFWGRAVAIYFAVHDDATVDAINAALTT